MKKVARIGLLIAVLSLVAGMVFSGPSASALAGGPDTAGMVFADSTEAGGPAVDFQDISGTGTQLSLSDDSVSAPIALPFGFNYYGEAKENVWVSSNGFVAFTATTNSGCCSGQPMPSPGAPNDLVALYWQDLNPSVGGSIQYETVGTEPNRAFIVQYTNVPHYFFTGSVTMQVKLLEATQAIEVQYQDAGVGGFGTITAGIENKNGSTGLSYCTGCGSLVGLAVRYSDGGAPASSISTADGSILVEVAGVQEDTVTGTATDVLSGVASVAVTFTDVLGGVTTTAATVTCSDGTRTSCTWSVTAPALPPGPYTVSEQATDRAGNAGAAGAGISILVV